jgi:hypothetical protein
MSSEVPEPAAAVAVPEPAETETETLTEEKAMEQLQERVVNMVKTRMAALQEHFVVDLERFHKQRKVRLWHKFIDVMDVHLKLSSQRIRLDDTTTYDEWGQNVLKCATRLSGYCRPDGEITVIARNNWTSFLSGVASGEVKEAFTIHENELCSQLEQFNRRMAMYRQQQEAETNAEVDVEADVEAVD